jgi:uncharacterized protein YerC
MVDTKLGRTGHKTPPDVLQAIREGVELGWSYKDLQLATGGSAGVVADVKRTMGLLPPSRRAGTHRQHTPPDVLAAAREMVIAGHPYKAVRQATGAPDSVIKVLRREAGLMRVRRPLTNDMVAAVHEAISMGMSYSEIKAEFRVSSAVIARVKHRMGLMPSQTPTPTPGYASPEPGDYFRAIRDGILEGYAREQALSDQVTLLQTQITEVESQNRGLRDTLIQTRARMSNWVGPSPLPHRNLSTGG